MDKIKVHGDGTRATRPDYYCKKCDQNFPSILDLEEHNRLDHGATSTTAAS